MESPFRFMVIDDPVQSMDPARVDPFFFRWCNEGAHEEQAGAMVDHIRRTEKLAGWIRAQA